MRPPRQFMVFLLVGIVSAILDLGMLLVLIQLGSHPYLAVSIAFLCGLGINLWLHSRLTFQTNLSTQNAFRFLIVVGMNWLIILGVVFIFEQLGHSYLFGKLVSLPLVAIHGFLWSRLWVFKS